MANDKNELDVAILGVERVLAEFRAAQEKGYEHSVDHMALHMSFFLNNVHTRLLAMKDRTVNFTCHGNSAPAYSCNKPDDQTGSYVYVGEWYPTYEE
jgi:hypothetical protein